MNRDRSRSRLSSPGSKSKIQHTIREALGRPHPDLNIYSRPRRSQSTKSLRSFNGSAVNVQTPYGYSATQRKTTANDLAISKICTPQPKPIKCSLKRWQWWHNDKKCQLITQDKTKQTSTSKSYLKYFAYEDSKCEKKKIVAAVENFTIFPGHSTLMVLLIDPQKYTAEMAQSRSQIKLQANKKIAVLIFEAITVSQSESCCQVILNETRRSISKNKSSEKLLDQLTRATIEGKIGAKFYLLLDFQGGDNKSRTLQEILKSQKLRKKLF